MKKWKGTDLIFVRRLIWVVLAVLVVIYSGKIMGILKLILDVSLPMIVGAVMAYVLNIIMTNLEKIYFPRSRKKFFRVTRRPVCILISFALICMGIAIVMLVVIPELAKAVISLGNGIPVVFESAKQFLLKHSGDYPQIENFLNNLSIDWVSIMKNISSFVQSGINQLVSTAFLTVSSIVSFVFNVVVAVIFAIYILACKEKLHSQFSRVLSAFLKPRAMTVIHTVLEVANDCFSSFFVGQFVEAIILGTLCFIGMSILGFPYASMTGTVIGATALIPILGAYIGAGVGALMICIVSPLKALEFLIFIVILQQLEGNLIYPRVVGTSIGLPGIWVFAAVMIGTGIAGVPGVLLGVPVAATAYKLVRMATAEREKKKELELQNKAAEAAEATQEEEPEDGNSVPEE